MSLKYEDEKTHLCLFFYVFCSTTEGQNTPGDLRKPGVKPRSPVLQADSLPAEPQGKSKNTGVGTLSLLQRSLVTQEPKQGLLHCRQILYQLS